MKSLHLFMLFFVALSLNVQATLAKFEPPGDKVLLLIGQDNETIGGQTKYNDGYLDHFAAPAGISHYIYFVEGIENNFGFTFDVGSADGLNTETTWGAGPKCLRCMLATPRFQGMIVHLSISMEFDSEEKVATGEYDHLIHELGDFMAEFNQFPFIIRIGYEFEGSWNHYRPEPFKAAWKRIVDMLRARNLKNFATLLGSARRHTSPDIISQYYPGDEYVDWIGYSYWHGENAQHHMIEFAQSKAKPVFIAETTPRGFYLEQQSHGAPLIWHDWFNILFDHIDRYPNVIKAVSYINTHWESQPMWKNKSWGDARLQKAHPEIQQKWRKEINKEKYLLGSSNLYEIIGFKTNTN